MIRCFDPPKDCFDCVKVDFGVEKVSCLKELDKVLSASIEQWKKDNVQGVWLKIPLAKSDYIAVCAKHKFDYHHALPGHVIMQRWLPQDTPSTLPVYAYHHVGCGGLVVTDANEILVIKENFLPNPQWKLPGGICDKGEDFATTAMREVTEETGIETEFLFLLMFRHMHKFRFQSSDIYFVCVLKPKSREIKINPTEVKDAMWMHIDDYLRLMDISPSNRYIVQNYKDKVTADHSYSIQPTKLCDHMMYTVQLSNTTEATHL